MNNVYRCHNMPDFQLQCGPWESTGTVRGSGSQTSLDIWCLGCNFYSSFRSRQSRCNKMLAVEKENSWWVHLHCGCMEVLYVRVDWVICHQSCLHVEKWKKKKIKTSESGKKNNMRQDVMVDVNDTHFHTDRGACLKDSPSLWMLTFLNQAKSVLINLLINSN